jgi:hypothetical protein
MVSHACFGANNNCVLLRIEKLYPTFLLACVRTPRWFDDDPLPTVEETEKRVSPESKLLLQQIQNWLYRWNKSSSRPVTSNSQFPPPRRAQEPGTTCRIGSNLQSVYSRLQVVRIWPVSYNNCHRHGIRSEILSLGGTNLTCIIQKLPSRQRSPGNSFTCTATQHSISVPEIILRFVYLPSLVVLQ